KFDGEVASLQSSIELVPEQISLKVQEVREWADGEINKSFSEIEMLSEEMTLKVDVDGVVSSINLGEEGIRIKGKAIHLDGETRIDDAIITSAMIQDLNADKIKVGILKGIDIYGAKFASSSGNDFMEIVGG